MVRRSTRPVSKPGWLADYVTTSVCYSLSPFSSVDPTYKAFFLALVASVDHISFYDAIKDSKWIEAMNQELLALEENDTWYNTDLPAWKKVIGCKWLYKTKLKSDGSVDIFKARLVIQGCR